MHYERQQNTDCCLTDKDEYGFPYELFECFSMEPFGFLETAMKLQVEAWETFWIVCSDNRHSPPCYIRTPHPSCYHHSLQKRYSSEA